MYEEKLTQKNNLTKFNNKKDQVIQGLNSFKTKIVDNNINNVPNNNEEQNFNNNVNNNKYKSFKPQQETEKEPLMVQSNI